MVISNAIKCLQIISIKEPFNIQYMEPIIAISNEDKNYFHIRLQWFPIHDDDDNNLQ